MTQPIRHATVEEFVREHNGPDDPCSNCAVPVSGRPPTHVDTGDERCDPAYFGTTLAARTYDGPGGYGPGTPRVVTAVAAGHEPDRTGGASVIDRDGLGQPARVPEHLADYVILTGDVVRRLRLLLTEDVSAEPTEHYRTIRRRVLNAEVARIVRGEVL